MTARRSIVASACVLGLALGSQALANGAYPKGSCASTGSFSGSGTCTVLDGESVDFTIVGAVGGIGGDGGSGGAGGDSHDGSISYPGYPGGKGGMGGVGGAGASVSGSYTNNTGSDVTLTLTVGNAGTNGNDGLPGFAGLNKTAGDPGTADPGTGGSDGTSGTDGGDSVIEISGTLLVKAGGGVGGQGGKAGGGGDPVPVVVLTPVSLGLPVRIQRVTPSALGAPGVDGDNGANGLAGTYSPNPLPTGWTTTVATGSPGIQFSGVGVAPATTTTVDSSTTTTVVGATTSTSVAGGSVTTTIAITEDTSEAPVVGSGLPDTGSRTGSGLVASLFVLFAGLAVFIIGRRHAVG